MNMTTENRTLLITNGNLLSFLSLRNWIDINRHTLQAVIITTKLPSTKNNILGVFEILRKSGLRYCGFKLLTNVFYPLGLKLIGKPYNIRSYLRKSQIPIIYTSNVNEERIVSIAREIAPDIILSFSATTRFSDELVSISNRVSINLHYALLPAYAGLSPYFWYLFNSEPSSGCTLHVISSKLDAGNIIEQRSFSMSQISSVAQVLLAQAKLASPMLNRFYSGLSSENEIEAQDLAKRTYYRHPNREQAALFHRQGKKYITFADIKTIYQMAS
jgi:methionyl-tRNA formyltransferase